LEMEGGDDGVGDGEEAEEEESGEEGEDPTRRGWW